MKSQDFSIERILLVLGPVRFIIFLLFPFLLAMCSYSYSIDHSIDDYVLHLMVFCLFINDVVLNHWNNYSSYYNKYLNSNQGNEIKNSNLSNLLHVKFIKKNGKHDPRWISPYMQKARRENHRFLYLLLALVILSIMIDNIPGLYRDWIVFFLSTFWSYLLVREIYHQSKNVLINKKFKILCYNLAFIVFVFGVLIIQN